VLVREGEAVGSAAGDGLGLGVERLVVVGRERDGAVVVTVVVAVPVSVVCGQWRRGAGNSPWKRNRPTMLLRRPALPTATMSLGLVISERVSMVSWSARTRWRDEAAHGLDADGRTQRDEEDAVDQRTKNFGTLPAVRVGGARGARCELDRVQRDDEREHIAWVSGGRWGKVDVLEHVERVGDKRERADGITNDQLLGY
jgi:hypothetical protein